MALGEAGRVIGGGMPPDLLPFYRSGSSGGPQIQRWRVIAVDERSWSLLWSVYRVYVPT